MKRLVVFAGALLFMGGPLLWAAEPLTPAVSTGPVVSTTTVANEPFVWPVAEVIGGKHVKVVSRFGRRKLPSIPALATSTVVLPADELHEGVDFGVPAGSNVRAARSGRVIFAGFSGAYVSRADKKDKNHLVIVRHADGRSTRYVHLDRLKVRPGQDVKSGEILGTSSASDEWPDPVLHFEIRETNGQALDPMTLLTQTQTLITTPSAR
jgi:murein DD-endopeptidase MepM/ murein hydrolase activator NlpD